MKYFWFLVFLFSLSLTQVEGYQVDARVLGFIPESKLFRQMYGEIHPEYQLELSHPIYNCFYGFGNIGYLYASGKSVSLKNSARLSVVPVSVGIKYLYPLPCCWNLYAGLGPLYAWVHEKNRHTDCKVDNCKHGIGGVVKLGVEKYFCCYSASLFVDYRYLRFSGHGEWVNISGFYFGGSVGYCF